MISQKDNEEGKLFVGGKFAIFNSIFVILFSVYCGVRWV